MSVAWPLCFPVVYCASFRFASATEYLDINSSNSPHSQSLFSFLLTIPVHPANHVGFVFLKDFKYRAGEIV